MKTRKLYYENCLLSAFTATVLQCDQTPEGFAVVLDATAFYPEGGGQACDLGTLDAVQVLHVREQDETVVHLCSAPLPVGAQVSGQIHWARRLDLMQQHTGEHIVSGIIHKMYGCHNVGFHVGADVITIDFDYPIAPEDLWQIEEKANAAIYENIPVKCWYPSQEQLPQIPYRSKKALPWPVRLVQIPEIDSCACCGVHTATTGQVGIIKLLSCVKFHAGVRIEMVCGKRAVDYLSRVLEQNRMVSQAFSAKLMETGAAAWRMNEALSAEKLRANTLQRQIFETVAAGYAGKGDVAHFAENLTPGAIRELAELISQRCDGTAAVYTGTDDAGYSICLVNKSAPVDALGKALNASLNGRGGGKPGFFQGTVRATRQQLETFLESFHIS